MAAKRIPPPQGLDLFGPTAETVSIKRIRVPAIVEPREVGNWIDARVEGKSKRLSFTDALNALRAYVDKTGFRISVEKGRWLFRNSTIKLHVAVGIREEQKRATRQGQNYRDQTDTATLRALAMVEEHLARVILDSMDRRDQIETIEKRMTDELDKVSEPVRALLLLTRPKPARKPQHELSHAL